MSETTNTPIFWGKEVLLMHIVDGCIRIIRESREDDSMYDIIVPEGYPVLVESKGGRIKISRLVAREGK